MAANQKEQIRVRLSAEEMATVRRIAEERNTTQSQVVIAGIRQLQETENFHAALAGLEQRIIQRLAQLPTLVWREVLLQSKIKQQKGDQR